MFSALLIVTHHPAVVEILGVESILGGVAILGVFNGIGETVGVPLGGEI